MSGSNGTVPSDSEMGATSHLTQDTQVLIRITRLEDRLGEVDRNLSEMRTELLQAFRGRQEVAEKCMTVAQSVLTGPNVKWFALIFAAAAAAVSGMSLAEFTGTSAKDLISTEQPRPAADTGSK